MLHIHRWSTSLPDVKASHSKRDSVIDETHFTADVEVCERCGHYRLRPARPLRPVDMEASCPLVIEGKE